MSFQIVDDFERKFNDALVAAADIFYTNLAEYTSTRMNENWGSGNNWLGSPWADLAEWNAGGYGGGKSTLTETGAMNSSDHSAFLYEALTTKNFNYESYYPIDERNSTCYAPLHQTGTGKMVAREWHPQDVENYYDFSVEDVDASVKDFGAVALEDITQAYQEAMAEILEL